MREERNHECKRTKSKGLRQEGQSSLERSELKALELRVNLGSRLALQNTSSALDSRSERGDGVDNPEPLRRRDGEGESVGHRGLGLTGGSFRGRNGSLRVELGLLESVGGRRERSSVDGLRSVGSVRVDGRVLKVGLEVLDFHSGLYTNKERVWRTRQQLGDK
jgi:hypothetical protein